MVKDLTFALENFYDQKTFSLRLPQSFDSIKDIEKVTSNTVKSVKLLYSFKKVVKNIGIIFMNKHKDQIAMSKAKNARKLLKEQFGF